ncbi:metalloregulator ArsR/SmtB family transcription factor [Mammaliicoccus sciuri]|uniref:ArsR/SmtB family transcription factor n=1 Tax=Mammaliicoccus TaxID=2803850 RepID=UPI001E42299E|nr:metalloregulator ArsR/SmtB family transcription factor [Mammaliicoccus sciuri]MCD8778008.1 metalloregulator ArsR/SmtB family transcription factor [Mammaliicoccus sciuri]MCD8779679.1 metalloregulator ArsR/SmtB family transcription factor [Mammaliicoccus sciuri]MEB6059139.1 metalloregulator ArsR/SmtB family transcription factor [Mammaliicoccus sciuri]
MSYKELSSIFKIFSDPSRLEILDLLSCGELCACELLEHFHFSQPTLSHHMKSLIDNNLVTTRKNGNKHLYQLNHAILDDITQNLKVINTSNQRCLCKSMKSGEC